MHKSLLYLDGFDPLANSKLSRKQTGGHTNTERGYLRRLARKLREEIAADGENEADPAIAQTLESLEVVISEKDKHPLQLV